jgi:hypothetical protein
LTKADAARDELHMVYGLLPDGGFLYTRGGAQGARAVYVGSLDASPEEQDATPLLKTDMGAIYAPSPGTPDSGHLMFLREFALVAQPFDARARRLTGDPRPVAGQVFAISGSNVGAAYVSASNQGALVYRTGTVSDLARQLAWFSRDGKALGTVGERARYVQLKLSPDGTRLVASQTELTTGNNDIWITELAGGGSTRFTFAGEADLQPTWSADGRDIAWVGVRAGKTGIYRKPADGAGDDELLYAFPEGTTGIILSDWSSDGFLVFSAAGDIFALPTGEGTAASRVPIPLVQTKAREFGPDLSPDSRWLVYISDESGRQELYVQPFAPGARRQGAAAPVTGKWMVSSGGTLGLARWRADGKEMFFVSAEGELMSIDVTATPVFKASPPRRLFQLLRPYLGQTQTPGALADITRDGQRLLLAMPSQESTRPELSVILNWQAAANP